MSRENFVKLLELIENDSVFKNRGRKQFAIVLQLAVTIYRLGIFGNAASIVNIAREFGISDGGIVQDITKRVIKAILKLKNSFIWWPNSDERKQIANSLANKKLPGCVGFIDGTHVQLYEKPVDDPDDYINRKNQPTIQLQLTVDNNKLIRHFYVGFPGSAHDARVYDHCDLSKRPHLYFSGPEYIIGDAAYPLSTRLITPYRKHGSQISTEKKKFNTHISSVRAKVEHANGILKRRFASLNGLRLKINKRSGHQFACNWISTCCILYNFLLTDPWTEEDVAFDKLNNRQIPDLEATDDDSNMTDAELDFVPVDKRNALKEFILNA